MKTHRIDHPHNEASALIAIASQWLLDCLNWDVGFWIANDEKPAHKAVAALGRRRGREGDDAWQVLPLKASRSDASRGGDTEDCECMARAGAWIYVFGSQFGSKDGPLDPERHFVARFNESLIRVKSDKLKTSMDVAQAPFVLHRAINDALHDHGLDLIDRRSRTSQDYIRATLDEAASDEPDWAGLVMPSDRALNVEGAVFAPAGRLLLGLRHPVTAEGHPLVVEIDGIDRIFSDKPHRVGQPRVTRIWVLEDIGTRDRPKGIRELDRLGRDIHVITGDLDSDPDRSRVLADHPKGHHADSEHWIFDQPRDDRLTVAATRVRSFSEAANAEGLALTEDGSAWYVHDDDAIRLDEAPPE